MTIERQLARYGDYLDEQFDGGARPEAVPTLGRHRGMQFAAAGFVVCLAVGAALVMDRDDGGTVVGATDGRPVALVPTEIPDGGVLTFAGAMPYVTVSGYAVYGDERSPDPSALLTVEISRPAGSSSFESADMIDTEVAGDPATYHPSVFGGSALAWHETDYQVTVYGGPDVDENTLRRFAETVTATDTNAVSAGWMPDGWAELWDGGPVSGSFAERYYTIIFSGGTHLAVTIWSDPPPGAMFGIKAALAARSVEVRGRSALVEDRSDEANAFLWWTEPSGVVVLVQHSGGDEHSAREFAESLVAVDQQGWEAFMASADDSTVGQDSSTGTTMPAVAVPDVVGLTVEQADAVLASASLSGSADERLDSSDPAAIVVAQEPPAGPGVEAPPGSVIGYRTAAPPVAEIDQCPGTAHPADQPGAELDDARQFVDGNRAALLGGRSGRVHLGQAAGSGYVAVVILDRVADCPDEPQTIEGVRIVFDTGDA